MTRKLTHIVIMAFFLSPLAFAGDIPSSTSSDDPAPAKAGASDKTTANDNPCVTSSDKQDKKQDKKKDKNDAKPAPTDQEKEFDRVLQGIYG